MGEAGKCLQGCPSVPEGGDETGTPEFLGRGGTQCAVPGRCPGACYPERLWRPQVSTFPVDVCSNVAFLLLPREQGSQGC